MDEDFWFTDNPTPLVNRKNWEPAKLDQYLNRTHCCTFDFECFRILSIDIFLNIDAFFFFFFFF